MSSFRVPLRSVLPIALLVILTSCAHLARDFLPEPGRYTVVWDGESPRKLDVLEDGKRRVLRESCATEDGGIVSCERVWMDQEPGVVELGSGVVLLGPTIAVGARWRIIPSTGRCSVWREVTAVGLDWVELEERGYCDGEPLPMPTLVSTWRLGRGPTHERVGGSRTRLIAREVSDAGR